jgi:hypothetical protein
MTTFDATALDPWVTQARTSRGARICIRPLRPDDREREVALLQGFSPRSRARRRSARSLESRALRDQASPPSVRCIFTRCATERAPIFSMTLAR